jgi:hypothetical protein
MNLSATNFEKKSFLPKIVIFSQKVCFSHIANHSFLAAEEDP